jgi:PAS domain S-box-containing protein
MPNQTRTRDVAATHPGAAGREDLLARIAELEAECIRLRREGAAAARESMVAREDGGELFRKILEIDTVGIIFFDPAGDITEANDAFLRMGGYTREDLTAGRLRWDRLTPPEWMPASLRAIDQLKTFGSTVPYEKQYYRRDGTRFWGLFAAKGLSEHQGMEFILDISERKEMEAALREAQESAQAAQADAEAANRAKADFLASMSHELRTPLNAMGGYVDLLELGIHGPVTEAQGNALSRVRANQRHLLTLINDILAYAKLEAGRVEFDLRPVDLCGMLSSVEPLVAPLAGAKDVAYSIRACDPALRAVADEERTRQVLLNLVTNAVKFTPARGWVRLDCDADGEWVNVRVRDNGPGVPPEKQEAIFDPFTQVDRRYDRPQEGVGLGLAISRDLARGMGGELSVESAEGEGSTFTLRLARAVDPSGGTG